LLLAGTHPDSPWLPRLPMTGNRVFHAKIAWLIQLATSPERRFCEPCRRIDKTSEEIQRR